MKGIGQNKRKENTAFTLIELLVCVAIIAVLMAIMMPSLGRARQAALSVKCLSNLRQIGSGIQMYTNDYNGYFVCPAYSLTQTFVFPNGWTYNSTSSNTLALTLPYLTSTSTQYIAGFTTDRGAYNQHPATVCPAFYPSVAETAWNQTGQTNLGNFAYKRGGTYSFNAHLNRSMWVDASKSLKKLTSIERMNMRMIYSESDTSDIAGSVSATEYNTFNAPALWFGHNSKVNMVFIDAHAESLSKNQIPAIYNFPDRSPWTPAGWGNDTPIPNIW